MFGFPNNTAGPWEKIFTDLYLKAKLLTIDPKSFKPELRQKVLVQMRDGRMYLLEAEFDKRIRAELADSSDPWHIAFTIGGFYQLFCYWAETGYEKTPQEIAEYVK